jgi:Selenocysteine synthase N terminal
MYCTAELIGIVEKHTASNEAALSTCAPASSVRTARADHADIRQRLPSTDAVLADLRMARALPELGTVPFKKAVCAAQERVRGSERAPERLVDQVLRMLPARASRLHPIINATLAHGREIEA